MLRYAGDTKSDGNCFCDDGVGCRWSRMSQQKIIDSNFAIDRFEKRFKELNNDALKTVSADSVEIVFAVSANGQNSGLLEQRKMMADGWLALAKTIAEFRDVEFSLVQQEEDDSESVWIRQHFAEMSEFRAKFGG